MENDSKITTIGFLIYVVYGVLSMIDAGTDYIIPYPLMVLLIPIISIIFFAKSIHTWECVFFLLFPLTAIEIALEGFVNSDLSWLGHLGGASVILFAISGFRRFANWKRWKWLHVFMVVLLIAGYAILGLVPQYLLLPVVLVAVTSLLVLLLNGRAFQLTSIVKRQYLMYLLASALLVVTYLTFLIN